jgi:hypothetical protein
MTIKERIDPAVESLDRHSSIDQAPFRSLSVRCHST